MPLFPHIAKVVRGNKSDFISNPLTQALAADQAIEDMKKEREKKRRNWLKNAKAKA